MTEPRSGRPDDFRVLYEWVAGSMPPPYHYEYTIDVGPGCEGQIAFRPDYSGPDTPAWTESFTLEGEQLDQLYSLMSERGVFTAQWTEIRDGVVGGSLEWLRCIAAGEDYSVPSRIEESAAMAEVYAVVKALVPEPLWSDLLERRAEYERNYVEPE